jgi:hypothetical protein
MAAKTRYIVITTAAGTIYFMVTMAKTLHVII